MIPIYFMIDLENTHDRGLQGAEYLGKGDFVVVFYSQSCVKVTKGKMKQLIDTGCDLELCRLVNTGKNALDFYIVSKIGEVFGNGYDGKIAVVSNDKGYKAVQDYWRCRTRMGKRTIILQTDIEKSILASNEDSERRQLIAEKLADVNLEVEFKKYKEHLKIRQELEEHFADTEYLGMVDRILEVVEGNTSHKVVYLNSLRRFGRKNGLAIYNKVKDIV